MEIYTFNKNSGIKISKFDSNFILSRILQTDQSTHIGCMHLEKNGIVGHHQAKVSQLLLIINGEGYVRGDQEEYVKVQPDDAVFWEKDEWHETKTDHGMTALVIEAPKLNPSQFMEFKA